MYGILVVAALVLSMALPIVMPAPDVVVTRITVTDVMPRVEYVSVWKQPEQFKTVDELATYLKDRPVNMPTEDETCVDLARFFMLDALKEGHLVSTQIVDNFRGFGRHMLACAVIGDSIYYIEPSTNEYWWAMPAR